MFVIGADIGQAQDPTALAVIESGPGLRLRYIERLPLGLSYPKVVERIERLGQDLPGAVLVLDATGVGRPVFDHLAKDGHAPIGVVITSGRAVRQDGGLWRVPKVELLRPLVTSLEAGRLKVAKAIPDAAALVRELQAFTVTFSKQGHAGFAGRGAHDDLVIATALAVWWASVGAALVLAPRSDRHRFSPLPQRLAPANARC